MWTIQHSENTPAGPATVWRLWSDVGGWPAWDSSMVSQSWTDPSPQEVADD